MKLRSIFSVLFFGTALMATQANAAYDLSFECANHDNSYTITSVLNSDQLVSRILHQEFILDHKGQLVLDYTNTSEVLNFKITDKSLYFQSQDTNSEVSHYTFKADFDYQKQDVLVYSGILSYQSKTHKNLGTIEMTCEVI